MSCINKFLSGIRDRETETVVGARAVRGSKTVTDFITTVHCIRDRDPVRP